MSEKHLFVLFVEEDNLCNYASGIDAVEAVRSHYDSLDSYCSPPDDMDMNEIGRWRVIAYQIPKSHENAVLEIFDRVADGEIDEEDCGDEVFECLASETVDGAIVWAQYRDGELVVEADAA